YAEVGRAAAIDGDVNLRVRDAQTEFGFGDARQFLDRFERAEREVTQLAEIGSEDVRGDREAALAFAAAERVARGDARPIRRIFREPPPHLRNHPALRRLALVDRQRLDVEMEVR